MAATPAFFNTAASSVAYDPDAAHPTQWQAFLAQIFGEDKQAMDAMQEFFGYCLSTDTAQQKMLLVVGPPRSGKGTMARVLRELAGPDSVAGPTMSSLSGDFGLEPLIPRPIAIISDARIGQRTDKAAVTERLLSISGEDTMSVNRKNTSFWHGKLQTRFIIITNEIPALADGSGALANRFIIVLLQTSFLGKEDPALFEKLKPEMPGILNWAIDGYQRLRERGHFVQPESATEALEEMMRIGSPVRAFVSECCEVGVGYEEEQEFLWDKWKEWCARNGNQPGSKNWWGRNLKTVVPGLGRKDRVKTKAPDVLRYLCAESPFHLAILVLAVKATERALSVSSEVEFLRSHQFCLQDGGISYAVNAPARGIITGGAVDERNQISAMAEDHAIGMHDPTDRAARACIVER